MPPTNPRQWILGGFAADGMWLVFPGLFAALLTLWIPQDWNSPTFLIFAFIATGFLGSGHIYTTFWRTYLNPAERRRHKIYLILPFALFAGFFLWAFTGIPYLGSFVMYTNIYHNVRQLFGISKWYQKLNRQYSKTSDFFLYALCGLPFLTAHFRLDLHWATLYSKNDALLYPHEGIYKNLLAVYFAAVAAWLIFEFRRYNGKEWNRISSVAFAATIYGFGFLYSMNVSQMLFPIVVSHAVAYIGLMNQSVQRVGAIALSSGVILMGLVFTALAFGGAQFLSENFREGAGEPGWAALNALWITPFFCHVIFDTYLWKRDHPEAELIYGVSK